MSYATFSDVQARMGRFAGLFTVSGKHPDQTDVEALLANVAADIDAEIRGRGFDPAGLSASAKAALLDVNAYGAMARALAAAAAGPQAADLLTLAETSWTAGLTQIEAGTHPAIFELIAGQGGETLASTGGDFWTDSSQDVGDAPDAFLLTGSNVSPWRPAWWLGWQPFGYDRRWRRGQSL